MKIDLNKIDIRLILLGVIVILVLLLLQQCDARRDAQADLAMSKQNNFALADSVREERNRAKELQFEKGVLITSEKGLRDLNAQLYAELKKQGNDIAFLQKIVGKLSTPLPPAPVPGNGGVTGNPCDSTGVYFADWEDYRQFDSLNYRKLAARTDITVFKKNVTDVKTFITEDEIGFDLTTGIKENNDGNYEIFVKSNYPGFKPTRIDGAFIPRKDLFPEQKKKNWSFGIGPQIGLGAGNILFTNTYAPMWYIGVGGSLQFTLFRF